MQQFFPFLGGWTWWVIAGLLLLAELTVPGIFFMWLALAAAVIGLIDIFADSNIGASVYCAGAVESNVTNSERNRPKNLTDTKNKVDAKMLEEEIHRYPFTAMFSAFSLGAVCGMMCRKS